MPTLIKKAALTGLIVMLLGLLGGYFFLTTESFREMARTQAIQWFEGRFRARLRIDQLEWRPFSNSLAVRGVEIRDPGSSDSEPAIRLREAVVNFSLIRFFSPRFDLQEVTLDGLAVRVRREEDGRINLARAFDRLSPQPREPSAEETGIRPFINLAIDHIRATDSQILYFDSPLSLQSLEGSLSFRLDLVPGRRAYQGDLQLRAMQLGVSGVVLPALDLETRFQLEDTRMRLDLVQLRADWLEGRLSGLIDGYQSLDHAVSVDVQVDAATVSEVYGLDHPLTGRFHVVGTARGSRGDYGLAGRVEGPSLQIADYRIENPSAEFRLDMRGTDLNRIQGSFQGVAFEASGQLWWKTDQISRFSGRSGSLLNHSLIRGLGPYARLSSAGRVTGEASFPGLHFSEWSGRGELDLPGTLIERGDPPLAPSFRTRARWSGDSSGFRIQDCRIELDGSLIDCGGTFENPQQFRFDFQYSVQGSAAAVEWARTWLPASTPKAVAGGEIQGTGSLSSGAGGLLEWQSQTGIAQLQLQGLELGGAEIGLRNSPDGSWEVDLKLDGKGVVGGAMSAVLDRHEFPLRQARGELHGEAGFLLDQNLNLEGSQAGANLEFSIDRDEEGRLNGPLRLSGSNWKLAGQEIPSLLAEGRFQEFSFQVETFQMTLPGAGLLSARGNFNIDERNYRLTFSGEHIDLSRVTLFDTSLPVKGVIAVSGSSSGSQWPPAFSLSVSAPLLEFVDRTFGPVSVRGEHAEGDPSARLEGSLAFRDQPFSFQGRLDLAAPYRFEFSSELSDLPPAFLIGLTPLAERPDFPPIEGRLDGSLRLRGVLSDPRLESAELRLDQVLLTSTDVSLRNRGPLQIQLANDRITLQEVTFEALDSTINLVGSVSLGEDPELNIRAHGNARLALLNPFLQGGNTRGQAEIQLVLGGTLAHPRLVGEVDISEAAIQHPSLPERLNNVRSRLRFTADQIAVEEFHATTSYGDLEVQGGVFLEGLTPSRWLLRISGQDLRLEYPENLISIMDVELDLARGEGAPLMSGIVHVRSADYQEDLSLTDLVLSYGQLTPSGGGPQTDFDLGLNITVNAYRAIRINNNLANIAASGDLKIRGTVANPVLQGSLTVDEGRLFLERNEYRIIRGGVNFNDPRRTRAILSFEAETQVQDYDINIIVSGPTDRPSINFRSDPPLPTPNIVTLLALGQTGEDIFRGGLEYQAGSLALYGAGALLNQSLNERLQRQSNRLFGLDRISIDPFLASSERDPGARVTLGKSLGSRLSVTYSTDLGSEAQGQTVVIQWKLTDWLTVVGTGEQNGALALDFKLRRRF